MGLFDFLKTSNKKEYVLLKEGKINEITKNIYEYKMYYSNEEKALALMINISEEAKKDYKEFCVPDSFINKDFVKIEDGRYWFESLPQIYYQIQNFFSPFDLLTEYDFEKINAYKDLTNEEINIIFSEFEKEQGKKPLLTFEEIGIDHNELPKKYYAYFSTLNKCQKYCLLMFLDKHRFALLGAILDAIFNEYVNVSNIKNLKYKVPVNKSFLSTMLYHYGRKGILYIEAIYNNDMSAFESNNIFLEVKTYLEMSEEKSETLYIPEEIWNCLFKNNYIGNNQKLIRET